MKVQCAGCGRNFETTNTDTIHDCGGRWSEVKAEAQQIKVIASAAVPEGMAVMVSARGRADAQQVFTVVTGDVVPSDIGTSMGIDVLPSELRELAKLREENARLTKALAIESELHIDMRREHQRMKSLLADESSRADRADEAALVASDELRWVKRELYRLNPASPRHDGGRDDNRRG